MCRAGGQSAGCFACGPYLGWGFWVLEGSLAGFVRGTCLRSGRPRGPGKALKKVGGFAPHILEGFPGPPGPARPQKRTPKNPARLPSGTHVWEKPRPEPRSMCTDFQPGGPILSIPRGFVEPRCDCLGVVEWHLGGACEADCDLVAGSFIIEPSKDVFELLQPDEDNRHRARRTARLN